MAGVHNALCFLSPFFSKCIAFVEFVCARARERNELCDVYIMYSMQILIVIQIRKYSEI